MRAIQTRFRPVSRGRAGAMLSKFSDIEICRGGVRTNRGPWAGGPRRAGRRDGSVARGGCGFISTHRTRRVEFCRIPRRRTYVEWRCILHIPIRSHYGSDQSKYQSQARSGERGVVRALFERCPYLVLFWSRGPLLSNDRSIERTLYVYAQRSSTPHRTAIEATPRHPFDPLWPPRPPAPRPP